MGHKQVCTEELKGIWQRLRIDIVSQFKDSVGEHRMAEMIDDRGESVGYEASKQINFKRT